VCSGRELYDYLGLDKSQWARWSKKNIENNQFARRGEDWIELDTVSSSNNGSMTRDYVLGVDFAERLCMMAQTEKGEETRLWFQALKKRSIQPMSQLDIMAYSVAILQQQEKRLNEVEQRVNLLEAKNQTHPDYFTVVGYASLNHMQVGVKQAQQIGQQASQICKAKGLKTDTTPDPRFGRVNMYPREVLQQVFGR
jgi:phage anti-repressor protein